MTTMSLNEKYQQMQKQASQKKEEAKNLLPQTQDKEHYEDVDHIINTVIEEIWDEFDDDGDYVSFVDQVLIAFKKATGKTASQIGPIHPLFIETQVIESDPARGDEVRLNLGKTIIRTYDGEIHCADGPAVTTEGGPNFYFHQGRLLSEEEFTFFSQLTG